MDLRFFSEEREHSLQREPKAQPANQNARVWMPNQILAREFCQQNFGGRRGGAHELAAIELQEMIAVVLVQSEPGTIGRDGFSESTKRFHVVESL
jgi:hypothetical protein